MKILYYHQYFTTPRGSSGTRSYEMARALVQRGHEVTVVCGGDFRFDNGLDGPFIRGKREISLEGIHVVQFEIPYSNYFGLIRRTTVFFSFAWQSTVFALTNKFDLIFATTTPLTIGIPGIFAKLFRRKAFVFEVRDLWPEIPRAMGVVKNPFVLAGMKLLEWFTYRMADGCIGLSPGIVEGIRRTGGSGKRIAMIPNGCDIDLFDPSKKKSGYPEGLAPDKFHALFTGAHGIANGLHAVLDAASVLKMKQRDDIRLVFVGDGKLKPALRERANREGLDNCIFLDPVSKVKLVEYLHRVDTGMMILDNIPAFYYGTSPNKFFDYIASGLPVITNYPGWMAELVEAHECGVAVSPESPEALAGALERLADNAELRYRMGRNARRLAEREFGRGKQAREFTIFLEGVGLNEKDV